MYYSSRQSGFIFRLSYLLLTFFFHVAIFMVAMLGLAHYWLPLVDDYKPVLEKELSDFVGNQISIGRIRIDRDSGEPRWVMENLQLTEPSGVSPVFIQQLTLSLDWRESLRTLRLQPADIRLEGVEFTLRQTQGELPEVAGLTFPLPGQKNTVLNIERQSPIHVTINGGFMHWQDVENRQTLSLADLQFEGQFLPNAITLQADALFPEHIGDSLMVDSVLTRVEAADGGHAWDGYLHTRTRIFNLAALPSPALRQAGVNAGDLMLDVKIRSVAGQPLHFSGEGEIRRLGLLGTDKLPAVQGINARFEADSDGGKVAVTMQDSAVDYPAWFEKSLPVERFAADLAWSVAEKGWEWRLENLQLLNADAEAGGSGRLDMPVGGDPMLSLDIDFKTRHKVRNVADYIPAVVPDNTEQWLKRAIIESDVPGGNIQVRGKLVDFPFSKNKGGHYDIRFDVEKGMLAYLPDWPVAQDVKGELHFRNAGMTARVHSARIMDLQVRGGEVRIPNMLKNARLQLDLDTDGDLQAHMDFLRTAPIGKNLRDSMEAMHFAGDSSLKLQLETSLIEQVLEREGVDVLGRLQLDDCRFEMPSVEQQFTKINGEVRFDHVGVSAESVKAEYRGEPVDIQAETDKARQQIDILLAQQNQPVRLLPSGFRPLLPYLDGETDIRTRLSLPAFNFKSEAGKVSQLQIQVASALQGVSINLPPPLRKAATESRDLQVDLAIPLKSSLPWMVDVSLGGQFRSIAAVPYGSDKLVTAGIALGGRQASLPDKGIAVSGKLDTVDLLQLAAFSPAVASDGSSQPALLQAELDIADLRLGRQSLGTAGLTMDVGKDNILQAHVRADKGQANLYLPVKQPERGRVNVSLQNIDLALLAQAKKASPGQQKGTSPADFPSILLKCQNCRKGSMPIRELTLDMRRHARELQIRDFRLSNNDMNLMANGGRWYLDTQGKPQTIFNLTAKVPDPGRLLTDEGEESLLSGGALQADGWLSWPGAPFEFTPDRLSGRVGVHLGKGSLSGVDPGIGRLLGLMNVQRLPDRLAMDFSDMTVKGVAFDEISGTLELGNGKVMTDDTIIKAPAMVAGIKGESDIANKTHRQELTVKPNFSSALPLVGTAVAGPGAGAALLLFNSLAEGKAEDRLQTPGGMRYRISGAWENPKVEPIKTPVVATDVDVFPY